MEEASKQFWNWLKEKTTSHLYLTYTGFYIAWNWKFFYALLLEDNLSPFDTRMEYALVYRFFENDILNLGARFVPPIIFTYLAIIYFPTFNKWAHSIYLNNYFSRKEAYDIANLEYEKRKTERLEQKAVQKEAQKKQREKIEQAVTQEEKWEREWVNIIGNLKNREAMKSVHKIVYRYQGRFSTDPTSSLPYIDSDHLSRLDLLELIDLHGNSLSFTPKGKFFIRLMQSRGIL